MSEQVNPAGQETRLEMREQLHAMSDNCSVEMTAVMVGGKWKLVILKYLMEDTHRFGELRKRLPGVTNRVLTRQLRELESCGLIRRTEYQQKPLRVDYSITEVGRSLGDVIATMEDWGRWYRTHVLTADADPSVRLSGQPRAE